MWLKWAWQTVRRSLVRSGAAQGRRRGWRWNECIRWLASKSPLCDRTEDVEAATNSDEAGSRITDFVKCWLNSWLSDSMKKMQGKGGSPQLIHDLAVR